MNKDLSIIVCVYNKVNFTLNALKDLSHLPNSTEIIVIDNNSSDDTPTKLQHSKEIIYYRCSHNHMWSGGNNIGFALSSASNMLFLNNDIRVKSNHDNWTQSLLQHCSEGLVGPTMGLLDNNFNFIKESNNHLSGNSYLSGWCIASSRENWTKLELPRQEKIKDIDFEVPQIFDENFFYFSDGDTSFRARQIGLKLMVAPVPVTHFGKISSQQLNINYLYNTDREKFIKKWKK